MTEAEEPKRRLDTTWKRITVALVCLIAAYATGSWAIDSGSWWMYFATMALLLYSAKLIIRSIRRRFS